MGVRRIIGDRTEEIPRKELDRVDGSGVLVGGILTDNRAPTREMAARAATIITPGTPTPPTLERYPIPIKITDTAGTDGYGNDLYDVIELDGEGNPLEETHVNVPNLGRPAATLSVDDQTDMGYSIESNSFFFSEAT